MSIDSQALRRLAVILVIVGASLLAARPASALNEVYTAWYSDATYSTLVGEEYRNDCTGYVWWWGVTTTYWTQDKTRCGPVQSSTGQAGVTGEEPTPARSAASPLPFAWERNVLRIRTDAR
ncbi:MAG TPA: hypothetical protein VFE33_18750 [Thermoanaerobaculia bacterium]|nr:hypothetical protein [Thermoanaerobaculia bacterium]